MSDIQSPPNKEVSLKEFILMIRFWLSYLFNRGIILLAALLLGLIMGVVKYTLSPKVYVADCNFILDEGSNSGRTAGLSELAFLGIATNNTTGLFQGKNLMWLYTSRLLLQEALLTPMDSIQGGKKFIDQFLQIDKDVRNVFRDSLEQYKFLKTDLSQRENQILSYAVNKIKHNYLKVAQTKEAENVITVTVKSPNEKFSLLFSEVIIKTVNDYYVKTKTQKLTQEIFVLQKKVDSLQRQMNSSMQQVATSIDATPFPNPTRQVLAVPAKRKGIDVELSSALFIEVMKNLETRKMALARETPLIQVLEKPVLPLNVERKSIAYSLVFYSLICLTLSAIILICIKVYQMAMKEN